MTTQKLRVDGRVEFFDMTALPQLRRARAIATDEVLRARLLLRKRLHPGDLFIDYGWIKLLYSGDSDAQEVAYHLHQAIWYEKSMQVFRSLLAPGQTAIDVGANSGFITAMFASLVGPEGRVLAFEPSGPVYEKLTKTIAANGLTQVVPFNFGCGAAASVERLHRVSKSSGNSSILGNGGDSIDIRVERLDDIDEAWRDRTALLKVDTEGYEPQVLRGAERLIAEHRPIIYLEMGGAYVDSTLESIALLKDAGYGVDHVATLDWAAIGNGADYFFFPRP